MINYFYLAATKPFNNPDRRIELRPKIRPALMFSIGTPRRGSR
jgi:hypothetical protein